MATLELRTVGSITGTFVVRSYQRGYRWGISEVEKLLQDIWDSNGAPYNLQPIVTKRQDSGEWELIDGQQRLTTIYLIYSFMHKEGLKKSKPRFSVRYETRSANETFLDSLDPERARDNIDFFHLFSAYKSIERWFGTDEYEQVIKSDKIHSWLAEKVSIVCYEASNHEDSITLFTRLNIGRIPLTDGELVKALLLTRIGPKQRGQTDPTHSIAAQWDSVERDLRRPEVWAFVSARSSDDYPTRITFLLDTLADERNNDFSGAHRPRFHTFETLRDQLEENPNQFWDDVLEAHSRIIGWFEDRDFFHKVGFLVATGTNFQTLSRSSRNKTKSSFLAELNQRIAQTINSTYAEITDLRYENERDRKKIHQVLLLMNVENVRELRHSTDRFPFHVHNNEEWSLEHIHAQNAQSLNRVEQWTYWLLEHREVLEKRSPTSESDTSILIQKINESLEGIDRKTFDQLAQEITKALSPSESYNVDGGIVHDTHSISNMALLQTNNNSALSNAVFEVKRQHILRLDRSGKYVPVCTRQVFLKYYTDADAQQPHFWSLKDREAYLKAMIGTSGALSPYLQPEQIVQ